MIEHLRRAALVTLASVALAAQAAPYTPSSDAQVVQRLPNRWDAATRQQRMQLARDPQRLPLALATARAAMQRARRHGDPRELGVAQSALAPWWRMPDAPAPVRLLRAMVLQSQHEFAASLADLDSLADDASAPVEVQAQAGLTRAAVLQVTGRLAEAERSCSALSSPRFDGLGAALSIPARACAAELRSLKGETRQASEVLTQLAREAPHNTWLALVRAELAQRMGDDVAAAARFSEAASRDADVYTLAAYADWLIDHGRDRDALTVVDAGDPDADALMLRRAIALTHMHDPRAAQTVATMRARFDAARLRGVTLHAREEARFALEVTNEPSRALALALENWSRQKEPADAVLLWRSARAAGRPAAAEALRDWAQVPSRVDVRLAGLRGGSAS